MTAPIYSISVLNRHTVQIRRVGREPRIYRNASAHWQTRLFNIACLYDFTTYYDRDATRLECWPRNPHTRHTTADTDNRPRITFYNSDGTVDATFTVSHIEPYNEYYLGTDTLPVYRVYFIDSTRTFLAIASTLDVICPNWRGGSSE